MTGDKYRFARRFLCAMLFISFLLMVGCQGATTTTGQPEATKAGEMPEAQAPVEPVKTEEPAPADLAPAEGWQPYPQGVEPVGDAVLAPGYEPMRRGVAAMNDNLQQTLLESGLKINTARTVILPETAVSAMAQNLGPAANTRLVQMNDVKNHYCMFRQDCGDPYGAAQSGGYFSLEGTSGDGGSMSVWATLPGEPGTVAEGLYGYTYWISWEFIGDPGLHCVSSFSIDFGPVTPLDYDQNGTPDLGFYYGLSDGAPPVVEQKENTLTFRYDPPICARKSKGEGTYSIHFSLTSAYPHRFIEAQVQDINGVTYPFLSVAPDYPPHETPSPSQPAGSGIGEVPLGLVELKPRNIGCLFAQNCFPDDLYTSNPFSLDGAVGRALFTTRISPGEPGTAAEGLYAYQYQVDLNEVHGDPKTHCVQSVSIDFGPVTPLDYDQNGTPDFGFVEVLFDGESIFWAKPTAVEQNYNTLTFYYDPPVCVGRSDELGQNSFYLGLASAHPPRDVEAQIQDINGVTYLQESSAPDYPKEQTIEETVSIAPVAAAADPSAFDQAKLEELFATEGVVLGMLVLETNAPDSLLPPGTYLERAYLDGNQGIVELIDVTSGETVYKVDLLAKKTAGLAMTIPSASIFLGSKTCLTCLLDWYICRPCFFWEPWMTPEECEDILEGLP